MSRTKWDALELKSLGEQTTADARIELADQGDR
jgi:hypothetical protein